MGHSAADNLDQAGSFGNRSFASCPHVELIPDGVKQTTILATRSEQNRRRDTSVIPSNETS